MSLSQPLDRSTNRLLSRLSPEASQRLQPHLELVSLSVRQPIYDVGDVIPAVYFPTSAIVSLVSTLLDGSTMEVGLVGHEGMAGIPVILGDTSGTHRAFVQVAGQAFRLKSDLLQAEFERGGSLQKTLLRYVQALFAQAAQATVCNRFHTTEERLARWLLLVADAVARDKFLLTQEFIGQMVGVRRAGVTVAASNLAQLGLIHYTRGRIEIVDRPGLEEFSCECYGVIRTEVDRLLGS